jgi:hypothetical protein
VGLIALADRGEIKYGVTKFKFLIKAVLKEFLILSL